MPRSLTALVVASALAAVPAAASSATARMNVSAVVVGRAMVTVSEQPAEVVVTAADVARRFVDMRTPFVVTVRTNSRNGCVLRVMNLGPAFRGAELRSGDLRFNVTAESFLARPYFPGGETLPLTIRLLLAPGAQEGRYAFPLVVAVDPLS